MLTKELSQVYKDAQAVTSLESSDSILVVDNNGDQKRISRYSLVSQGSQISQQVSAGESGWLRIAQVSYNSCGIIKVAINWGSTPPAVIFFAYSVHVNGHYLVKCISRLAVTNMFSKIRIVKKASASGYIDVYAPITSGHTFNFSLLASTSTSLTPGTSTDATVPDGYDSVEFTSANWRGGKSLPFNKLRNLAERRVA